MNKMDQLFCELKESDQPSDLYNNLAPLYDFIYKRHYNYNNQKDLILDIAPDDSKAILEGACGVGRLTEKLVDEYNTVYGVDLNNGMINIAIDRVPEAHFHKKDLKNINLDKKFDILSILGNSVCHFTGDKDFKLLCEKASMHLKDGGIFVFDYEPTSRLENGRTGKNVISGGKYIVERNHICTKENKEGLFRFNFSFKIKNIYTDEEVKVGESILIRSFKKKFIKNNLLNSGFSNVRFEDSSKWSDGAELVDLVIAEL